jgi:hypothetical protein
MDGMRGLSAIFGILIGGIKVVLLDGILNSMRG